MNLLSIGCSSRPRRGIGGAFLCLGTPKLKKVHINLLPSGYIQIEDERYAPWPNFRALGVKKLRGLWNPKHLKSLLTEEDLFCDAWRRSMPREVLMELQGYSDHHCELLELAQLDTEKFSRLSQRNPALTLLIAAYWTFPGWRRMPVRKERDATRRRLLRMKDSSVLAELGFEKRKSWVRVLGKIPARECHHFHVSNVLKLCRAPRVRRYLPYLSSITMEVSWLLRQPMLPVDMPLLEFAAREPYRDGMNIDEIVGSIAANRDLHGIHPVWPYAGRIRSWSALLKVEQRNAKRCGSRPEFFPPAPVSTQVLPEGLEIMALPTPRYVKHEAHQMANCSAGFIDSIYTGSHYLYRVTTPERATVLLERIPGGWDIQEIGLHNNEGEVSAKTEQLLSRWLCLNQK